MHPYRKMVRISDILEIYEYEKPLTDYQRGENRRKRIRHSMLSKLGVGGTAQEGQKVQKRKDNALRSRMAFIRLVQANFRISADPLLVTFTYAENMQDLRRGYKDFHAFIQHARYQFGKEFSYISVPEFQVRGAVHFHTLFWGLPDEVFTKQKALRILDKMWAKGFVYIKKTDGSNALSGYLAKYMSKTYQDERNQNLKSYTASKNILRPYSTTLPQFYDVLSDYGLSTAVPLQIKEYQTQWLGKCRKSIYQFKI